MRWGIWIKALAVLLASLAALQARAEGPVVFAAASLRGVLEQAVEGYAPAPRLAYGGSGAMAQQIARGAPADLVILASPDWMSWLADAGHVPTPTPLLGNRLVLIAAEGAAIPVPDADALLTRLAGGRLAMGQRRAVPAGVYAQAWLETISAWRALEPHLAEAANVRAALAFVAERNAPLGIVYATDAAAEARVRVVYEIPEAAHPPIRYPAAALSAEGAALLAHLRRSGNVFAQAGFTVLP